MRTFIAPAFHCHDVYELYLLKSGQRDIYIGNRLYTAQPGDTALILPGTPHRSFGDTPYSGVCVEFTEDYIRRAYTREERQMIRECFAKPIISIPREAVDFLWQEGSAAREEECQARKYLMRMMEILRVYQDLTDPHAKLSVRSDLSPMGSYIQKHYLEIKGLDDLADHYGRTKSYLCRVFKQQTGISIVTYINSLKIQHACQYLEETDLPVKEIAARCGFSSVIYFNRVFKAVMEQTPEAVRRKERDNKKYIPWGKSTK